MKTHTYSNANQLFAMCVLSMFPKINVVNWNISSDKHKILLQYADISQFTLSDNSCGQSIKAALVHLIFWMIINTFHFLIWYLTLE